MIKIGIQLDKNTFLPISVTFKGNILERVILGKEGREPPVWAKEWLANYERGALPSQELFLDDVKLTAFEKRVLQEIQKVPFGKTLTYKELAIASGSPKGYRAVARVCAKNPWPLFVPCHRIVRTGGGLGGFAFGLPLKKALLQFEKTKN